MFADELEYLYTGAGLGHLGHSNSSSTPSNLATSLPTETITSAALQRSRLYSGVRILLTGNFSFSLCAMSILAPSTSLLVHSILIPPSQSSEPPPAIPFQLSPPKSSPASYKKCCMSSSTLSSKSTPTRASPMQSRVPAGFTVVNVQNMYQGYSSSPVAEDMQDKYLEGVLEEHSSDSLVVAGIPPSSLLSHRKPMNQSENDLQSAPHQLTSSLCFLLPNMPFANSIAQSMPGPISCARWF
ncbi:hypothetical protein BKA82DRAFT_1000499 [Pisolithus tinctorius]|uniref:Uncharacterized protein n=1 Tax=Pisolithus tinctorius Marx 270 TaxID=870435 RepID=A0A0C3NUZ4_PISTI|nr:hypothetical protein BKA82DRAFT_1000499 [Pisolithus tinctorius]KIO04700.1 hypothetical protein M404DRAFT_1000499 [Pisolithus tinctorius Marx 270]